MFRILRKNKRSSAVSVVLLTAGLLLSASRGTAEDAQHQPPSDSTTADAKNVSEEESDRALAQARREVKMLDDIYKTSIVLITTHYVDEDTDLPAGSAFKALFEAVEKKGWHKVRLVDASGEAVNDENYAKPGFEKRAIAELLKGKPAYEEIESSDGKRYLKAATAIPVVMDKCIMCHENYRGLPQGRAIGALSYQIPILD